MGVFLVTGNLDRDVRSLAGDRSLDALLKAAMTKLQQRVFVEPEKRYFPFFGCCDQGCRARAQLLALSKADEVIAFFVEIKSFIHFTSQFIFKLVR